MSIILDRSHLFQSLNPRKLPKILLITAPSGFGKTVLAGQLVDWLKSDAIWHRLNASQRDWAPLAERSIGLLKQYLSGAEHDRILGTSPVEAAQNLTESLELKEALVYIFDDIQYLLGSPHAELWLKTFIETLPPKLHLVFVGKDLPFLPWSQYLAQGWVWSLSYENLCLSVEEIQTLGKSSAEKAELISQQTGGWIAGVRLALDSPDDAFSTKSYGGQNEEQLFAELAMGFLKRQSPDFQNFLFLSALPEEFNQTLCQEVFGFSKINAQISRLQRQNFFIQVEASGYRYHETLRQFLREHFKSLDAEAYRNWHKKLGDWYEKKDDAEAAIWHYIQAQCFSLASNLADQIGKELQTLGRWETILQIFELLGEHTSPIFQLRAAIILTEQNRLKESEQVLSQALDSFYQVGDGLNVVRCHLHLAFNYNKQGFYEKSMNEAHAVLESEEAPEDLKAWASRTQALAYLELGESAHAIEILESILPFYSQELQARGRSNLLQDLSAAYMRSGNLDMAGMLLQEILVLRRQVNHPNDLALALNDIGYYYHCNSQYEDALTCFAEGLSLIKRFGGWTSRLLLWSRGDVLRDLGRFEEAEEAYLAALNVSEEKQNAIYPAILMSMAQLRLWQERLADAHILLEEANRLLPRSERIRRLLLEIMFVVCQTEAQEDGAEILFGGFDKLLDAQAFIKYAQALGLSAHFLLAHPQKVIRKRFLTFVERLPNNLFQPLTSHIKHQPKLQTLFKKQGLLQAPSIQEALEKLKIHTDGKTQQHPYLSRPKRLELETLGKSIVILNGEVLADSAWTTNTAKELFFYLYFKGKQTKDDITVTFWPEHGSQQVRGLLHNTLSRLRQALPEAIMHDGIHYHLNTAYSITADSQQFSEYVHRAKQLSPKDVRTEDLLRRAEKLYQGVFLPSVDATWIEPFRRQIEGDYVSILLGLAACALGRDKPTEAIPFFERALDKDPYNEEILRDLMLTFARTGQAASAQLCFDNFARRLEADLDIAPSQLTWDTLFKVINSGH